MSSIDRAVEKLMRGGASLPGYNIGAAGDAKRVEVQPVQGQSQMVSIDLGRLKGVGIITPDVSHSVTSEEIRRIKRPLLRNAFGQGGAAHENSTLIMVTSARPNEGKTFFAVNLAMSIALERDHTVLLVDADVASPAIHHIFGIDNNLGLVDCLVNSQLALSDVLLKTDVARLAMLPAGRRHHHSTELLASEGMRRIVHELCTRYHDRVVIFDSPPLLATSEADVLAGYMGQIVVVVEEEKTHHDELKEALSLLDVETASVGLVLNKSRDPTGHDYYGYGK